MTSRQARRERRTAERKNKKAEMKRMKAAAIELGFVSQEMLTSTEPVGFVSQTAQPHCESAGFVSQNAPSTAKPGFVSQNRSDCQNPRSATNRANALHSTGPRTEAGKAVSARNATKHGLASGQLIVPGENPTEFESLLNNLLQEHHPASPSEELLVGEIAQSWWLTQRAIRLQNECFTLDGGVDEKRLSLLLRYQTTHQRAFHKALNTLGRLQKERRKLELGFVSQDRPIPAHKLGFVSQTAQPRCESAGFVSQTAPEVLKTGHPDNESVQQNPSAKEIGTSVAA